jgi:TetR/AcrR family transcriptional regulator, regulator of cefoperazone and chloramphenicol sensitivity
MLRLHFRELVEPTGLWQEEIDNEFKPMHAALLRLLCRELQCVEPDDDMQRLAFALLGMAVNFFVAHDVIGQITPQLLRDARAVQVLAERLATYACDLVLAEAARRRAHAPATHPRPASHG